LGFVLKTHRPFAPPHSPTSFIPILSFVRSGFPGPNLNHAPAGVCQMKIKIELSSCYSKQTNMQVFFQTIFVTDILALFSKAFCHCRPRFSALLWVGAVLNGENVEGAGGTVSFGVTGRLGVALR
jgi:hypothetical protein